MKSLVRHKEYLLTCAVILAALLAALSQYHAPVVGDTVITEPDWEVGDITPSLGCVSVWMDRYVFTTQERDMLFHIKNNSEYATIEHYGPPSLQIQVDGVWYGIERYSNMLTLNIPSLDPGEERFWPMALDRFGTCLTPGHYRAVITTRHRKTFPGQADLSCDCVNDKFAGVEFDVVP